MTTRSTILFTALTAALVLSIGATAASASRSLSVSATRITANGRLTFNATDGSGVRFECAVTFVRTVSRAIPKVSGILLGKIIDIRFAAAGAECRVNVGTLNSILIIGLERDESCRLFFENFTGTLPRITGIRKIISGCLLGYNVTVLSMRLDCRYQEDGRGIAVRENLDARGVFTSLEIGANVFRLLASSSALCPREITFLGTFAVTGPPTFTLV